MEAVAATAAPAEGRDARALAGERTAFTTLYGPQFEGVYDFVLRTVGEREVADAAVRETFARARQEFPEQGNEVSAWLFTTARTCALESLRHRRDRNGGEREALDFTRLDSNRVPDATVVFDHALVELVWDRAAALPREEYSLLALDVRHDVPVDGMSARIRRMRDAFDEQVTSRLVADRARHTCTALEILVAQGDERDVAEHVRRCPTCRESTRAFVSPSAVLAGLARIAPARGLRREIFGRAPRRRVFGIL